MYGQPPYQQPSPPLYAPAPDVERVLGIWRRSMFSVGFWLRVMVSLSLYYWFLWPVNQITLTNRRITQRRGSIFTGTETSITIGNISNITVRHSLFGLMLGYGDIIVESPGIGAESRIDFHGIANPDGLKNAIYNLQNQMTGRR